MNDAHSLYQKVTLTSYNDDNCYMDLHLSNRNNVIYSQSYVVPTDFINSMERQGIIGKLVRI